MPDTITLRVLFFSELREHVGRQNLVIQLDSPAKGDDLLDRLTCDYPSLVDYSAAIRLAVNQRLVPRETNLQDGDEVAVMTPFSGG